MIRFVGQQEQKNKILGSFNDEDWVVMEGEKELSITKSLQQQKIMGNKIRLYHPYLCGKEEKLSLLQLLLDERYAEGCLCIPVEVIKECGYLNERMPRKKCMSFCSALQKNMRLLACRRSTMQIWCQGKIVVSLIKPHIRRTVILSESTASFYSKISILKKWLAD